MKLRYSTPQEEGIFSASKWLKVQVLLQTEEMQRLVEHLAPFSLYSTGEPLQADNIEMSPQEWLAQYDAYIGELQEGRAPSFALFRRPFSVIWTADSSLLYAMPVAQERVLVKALKPVIQLQAHYFYYSSLDKKYHPMVLSKESVAWGLQFSYPQIYQDPRTKALSKVANSPEFPNTALFLRLVRWLREHSAPTPFIAEGIRKNVPIRLGKSCFPWIQQHAGLKERGIHVAL